MWKCFFRLLVGLLATSLVIAANGDAQCACENGGTCTPLGRSSPMAPVKSTFACRCPTGFFGDRCDARECVGANPCANGAPCQQIGDRDHLCHCALGFEGANCERKTRRPANPCGALDCGEWGRCQVDAKGGNATCTCDRHYIGAECNVYQYDFCSTALYSEPCNRRGQCVNVPTGYRCECAEGFGGDYCEEDVDQCATGELKCENDGLCVNQLGHDFCKCPDGFGGRRCERKTEEDRCEEGVCLNGGHCNVRAGHALCSCPTGFSGRHCELADNPCVNPHHPQLGHCFNGGVCLNEGGRAVCSCLAGHKGERCEEDVDECKLSDRMCLNGATCVNRKGSYECMCLSGFTGQFCEINVDDCLDNPCGPEATCVDGIDSYTCECPPGRYGHDCSLVDVCLDNPCVHGNCSINSDGTARCDCASAWIGEKCDEDLNECEWEPCRNGGTCVNTFGGYRCECADGFEGADCETPRNYCDAINGRPCKNGGTCLNHRLNHTCVCMPGFSGDICEIRDDTSCGMECENGGVCDWNSDGPRCACSLAFTGRLCEIALPDPCAHDYCGSNGMCFPANDYSSYQCACNPGFSGEHCEIRECTEDPCVMSVRHCQEKEITCGGHGRCIDIEDDYRCICDKHFTGRHCELMSAESSLLSGDVLLFLVGNRENVSTRLGDILSGIGRVLHVNVRVHLDENDRPMVYAWDSEKGKGEPLEEVGNFIDIHDKSLFYKAGGRHRRSAKLEGALLYLQIDISPCHEAQRFDRNLTCPHSVRDVALELATNTVQEVLGPLGFSVHKADFEQPTSERTSPLVFVLVAAVFLVGMVALVATRPWARKKPSYRDANVVSVTGQFNPPLMKDEQSAVCSMFNQQYPQQYQHYTPLYQPGLYAASSSSYTASTSAASTGSYSPLPDDPNEPRNVHDPKLDPLLHRIIFQWKKNEKECLRLLKEAFQSGQMDVDVNAVDGMKRTALMMAAFHKQPVKVFDLLHSNGADASLRDRDGRTAFHFAIERGHPNGAAWLLDNTAVDFTAVSRGKYTALKLCALQGDVGLVFLEDIFKRKEGEVDVNATDEVEGSRFNDGNTPLHVAAEQNAVKIIDFLVDHGADVDAQNLEKETPLIAATSRSQHEAMERLLHHGAKKELETADGRDALYHANRLCDKRAIKILENFDPNARPSTSNDAKPRAKKRGGANAGGKVEKPKKPRQSVPQASVSSVMLSPPSDGPSPTASTSSYPQFPYQPAQARYQPNYAPQPPHFFPQNHQQFVPQYGYPPAVYPH